MKRWNRNSIRTTSMRMPGRRRRVQRTRTGIAAKPHTTITLISPIRIMGMGMGLAEVRRTDQSFACKDSPLSVTEVEFKAPGVESPSSAPRVSLATRAGGPHGPMAMQTQRLSIKGRVFGVDDPAIQEVLAQVHHSAERPRCLCVPGGVEMYVSRHGSFLVKRMPETGRRHRPSCSSYEPDPAMSGFGELVGNAIREVDPGAVELSVDFPWMRTWGRSGSRADAVLPGDVEAARRRMSLHGLIHFLFERAGFNRWTPAMEGKRNQGVLHKYLTEAARDVHAKGVPLAQRLYVPEPFIEATHLAAAQRRRAKLEILRPIDGRSPLALVLGEFKAVDTCASGHKVWIRHMPDAPLLVDSKTWKRIEKAFAPLFEARDTDLGYRVRLIMAALIRARREHTYEIDAASLMLTSAHWIPVEGVHELPLVHALIEQRRRFIKPLRYDAHGAARFPNAMLLDMGPTPLPMHVFSPFMTPKDREVKEAAVRACDRAWVWPADETVMPALPAARP